MENRLIKIEGLLSCGWSDDPNTLALLVHLLSMAYSEDGEWHGLEVKRGQVVTSLSELSVVCGMSARNTRTALDHLVLSNEVSIEPTNRFSRITLSNFEKYIQTNNQDDKEPNKKANNKATIENKPIKQEFSDDFIKFWGLYPNKTAKPKAWLSFKRLTKADVSAIMEALPKHIDSDRWQRDGGQFIPHPTTWLNQRRWEDEIEKAQDNRIIIA